MAAILKLKDIISSSVESEIHPDYIEKKDGKRVVGDYNPSVLIHRLYGAIEINGQIYRVKTTVKELLNDMSNKAYTYEVTNIELLDGHTELSSDGTTPRKSNNSIPAAKLLNGVEKSYDPGVKLLDVSSSENDNSINPASINDVSQTYGSANTSLRQVASAFGKIDWKEGTTNVDIGGGRFDEATNWLKGKGVENLIFDPFNRRSAENREVAERIHDQKADTATVNNVLNVIDTEAARANVILQAAKAIKPDGTAYFSVYEGNGSGEGRQTGKDQWQNNRKTADYLDEIRKYFGDVTMKNKVIIAKDPIETKELSVWNFGDEADPFFRQAEKDGIPAIIGRVSPIY